jgi:hypothetical protein
VRTRAGAVSAALLLAIAVAVAPVSADVVELKNGQRVEGAFKGADDSAVKIEVHGRIVTFAPAEVRAIYYGPAPAPPAPAVLPERDLAIGALAMLRAVAKTGVIYQEYDSRLGQAQAAVDRYLQAEDGAPAVMGAITASFHFYALAGMAWNAGLSRGNYAAVGSDPALNRCEPAQQVITESKRRAPFIWRSKGAGEAATTGTVMANEGLSALWSCASDRLAAAERLRADRRR